jgi:hypothetical protein
MNEALQLLPQSAYSDPPVFSDMTLRRLSLLVLFAVKPPARSMHLVKKNLPVLGLCAALAFSATISAKEETLILFQDHHLTIDVPEGYLFSSTRDDRGIITVKIGDPKEKIDLQVSFFPDAKNRLATEEGQMSAVAELCQPYAEGSVEKSYDFKALSPQTGTGTYCVFTDATLVKKMPFPPGEFLNVTCGVKSWPACYLIFTLLSNDTTSKEYQTAMKLVKTSFEEKADPGKTL